MSSTFIVFYDDPNHYIKNLPLHITNERMDNRRLLIIAAIIIMLISVVTIYLAPSDTIIPLPNPNENSTRNESNISTPNQDGLSQQ
ncbi:MAG: hypothetical protein ACRD8Z_23780, partial [Nitrososphaeraceae archaeon]